MVQVNQLSQSMVRCPLLSVSTATIPVGNIGEATTTTLLPAWTVHRIISALVMTHEW